MKTLVKKLLPAFLIIAASAVQAQTNGKDFKAIDAYVKSLGSLEGMSMGTINNVLINKYTDKMEKARAIYYWIANNITFDVKLSKNNNALKNTPAEVLKTRRATAPGFASLFQDLCSSGDIRCLTVDGFVKHNTGQIGEKDIEVNHTWAVVQLGQSPEEWYYVDAAFGSGYFSADMKEFTKYYSDAYFFTEKASFNQQHYPDNKAWKLGSGPDKGDFFDLPVVKTAAMEMVITKCSPNDGKLKVKADKNVKFNFTVKNTENVTKVELGVGDKKRYRLENIDYSNSATSLGFTYKFKDTDSGPITIFVNGKEFVQYYVEVE
jgi:transglutaminase/protease-like cytokinesis protein 3